MFKGASIGKIIAIVFLCFFAVIWIVPLLWIVISSFKIQMEINKAGGFLLLPETWTLDSYRRLFDPNNKQLPIIKWFLNSFFISGIHTVLAVIIFSMAGYAYAKMKFAGRELIFICMMGLTAFPAIINLIPLYKMMFQFNLLNGPWAIILPGLSGVFNVFLIRQFMYGIPDEMLEAARIDGANEFVIFVKIIVPLAKPILITVALFSFTGNWNDFLWPSIAINNIDKLTLTAGLQLARGAYISYVPHMSAIAVTAIVPMIILYLCTQRYFISGISISSGVKG